MKIIAAVNELLVWPILALSCLGAGVYLSVRMGFVQLRLFRHAWAIAGGKYEDPEAAGELTHSQAFHTALAATLGTGSIAGVATAIALGGPGAVFWMWLSAFFGMVISLFSGTLAVRYRTVEADGRAHGGPMYFLENGLRRRWLGILFAGLTVLASLGIGNLLQASLVAEPLERLGIPRLVSGSVLGILLFCLSAGGVRRIGRAASQLVPLMLILYIAGGLGVLLLNLREIPAAFLEIFRQAFHPTAAVGGFAGSAVLQTLQIGVVRGFTVHAAGLGSPAIADAAAKTGEPVRQGLAAMLRPCVDTVVICTITALVIVLTGGWQTGLSGVELAVWSFHSGLPGVGSYVVISGMVLFAFTTALAWSYFGGTALGYLAGSRMQSAYRWVYALAFPLGAALQLSGAWAVAELAYALMAVPNMVGVFALSGEVRALLCDYRNRVKKPDEGKGVLSEGY